MDEQTALVLALQLVALFSITGALLLYLLCKIKSGNECAPSLKQRSVVVTSCDNALGLQIALHLAAMGFRVFAGLREAATPDDSVPQRVMRAWQKQKESEQGHGALIPLLLDVTREDLLHEAVGIIRAHLPAGEDGLWSVVNTSGVAIRGRLDQQDVLHWDAMLKTNVVGLLRVARTFQSLLGHAGGRLVAIGAAKDAGAGLVAYSASRSAADGASRALREEMAPAGVKVVCLRPEASHELFYSAPRISSCEQDNTTVDMGSAVEFGPVVLSKGALRILNVVMTADHPKNEYFLEEKMWSKPFKMLNI